MCVTIVYYTTSTPPPHPASKKTLGQHLGIECIQISAAKCMNIHTMWGQRTINSLIPIHQFKSGFATKSTRKMTLVCKALFETEMLRLWLVRAKRQGLLSLSSIWQTACTVAQGSCTVSVYKLDVIRKQSTRAKQRRFFSRAVDAKVSQSGHDSPGSEAR